MGLYDDSTRKLTEESYQKLKESGCPWEPYNLDDVIIQDMVFGDELVHDVLLQEGSFHPDGCCGCVVMPDEYICGIRCDHLIWMTGEHEQVGHVLTDDGEWKNNCLLLVANHKGLLCVALVYEDQDRSMQEFAEDVFADND